MRYLKLDRVPRGAATAATMTLAAVLLGGCASTPERSSGAIQARSNLTTLENDRYLGDRAVEEIGEAEHAVTLAEEPLRDSEARLNEHRVYMANQKIEIARAKATARYAEAQRELMGQARDDARLQARTSEADKARREQADLKRQLDALQAKSTDRGIVLTLGDTLFATGSSELQRGSQDNLSRLADFLNQHPERRALIEGHTDSVGNAASNQRLSLSRADSVRAYLTQRGISPSRLSASGMGQDRPIASNDSAQGRQQNRRVEVIIANPPAS